jgi:hypothetical protein
MENTAYALRPLLAEIRDGFRGMRAIRISRRAATRESARETQATTARATRGACNDAVTSPNGAGHGADAHRRPSAS